MNDEATRLGAALADRYRIERELGAGGMATVYLAHDLKHDRDVALKVLHPDLAATIGIDRFLGEIRVTANLQHPNILPLFDSGSAEGQAYYVMPYVNGESLRDKLSREGQLPLSEAIKIASGIAAALDYAHNRGVIHRDIKPENILLQGGQPVVADFGIALAVTAAGGQRLTQTGLSLGTPQYMSPEQAMGEKTLDARTDIYALGVVAYEMLAGEPPFTGPSTQAIIAKVLTERAKPVTALRERVPAHIARAVDQAIERLPADRFRSAHEFAEAIEAPNTTAAEITLPRTVRRRRWPLGAAAIIGLVLGTAAMYFARPAERHAAELTHHRLTFDGRSTVPEISPDGRYVAYVAGECDDGPVCSGDVVVRELPVGQPQVLARGVSGLGMLRWNADASQLAFNGTLPVGSGVFIVLRSGGAPRLVGPKAGALGFYSAKDIYSFDAGTDLVRIIDVASGAVRDSVRLAGRMANLDWSLASGEFLAARADAPTHLAILSPQGAILDTVIVTTAVYPRWRISGASILYWAEDGSEVVLVERDVAGGRRFTTESRVLQRGVPPLNETASSARDGRLLIGRVPSNDNLWTFDLSVPGSKPTRIGMAPESYFTSPHLSRDGKRVAYSTFDLQGLNAYVISSDGGEPNALTHAESGTQVVQAISHDGAQAFIRSLSGDRQVLTAVDIATGRQRRIDSTTFLSTTSLSPVGQLGNGQVVFTTRGQLFRVDSASGKVMSIVKVGGTLRQVAPDGNRLVIYGDDPVEAALYVVDATSGTVSKIATLPRPLGLVIGWGKDGFLYLPKQTSTGFEIWRMPDTGGAPMRFATLPVRCWPSGVDVAVDAKRAACYATDMFPDIWLLDSHP